MNDNKTKSGGLKGALTRKFGPLPAWAWALLLGVGVWYYRNKMSGASSATPQTSTTGSQDPLVVDPGESTFDPGTGGLISGPGGSSTDGSTDPGSGDGGGDGGTGDGTGGGTLPGGNVVTGRTSHGKRRRKKKDAQARGTRDHHHGRGNRKQKRSPATIRSRSGHTRTHEPVGVHGKPKHKGRSRFVGGSHPTRDTGTSRPGRPHHEHDRHEPHHEPTPRRSGGSKSQTRTTARPHTPPRTGDHHITPRRTGGSKSQTRTTSAPRSTPRTIDRRRRR